MQIKNISGEALSVPLLDRTVAAGEVVEVTGDTAKALLRSTAFERVDQPAPRQSTTTGKES